MAQPNAKWATWPSYGRVFGAKLRYFRRMRGLTQAKLGQLCGMSRNQISNLERNDNNAKNSADPTLSTVYKLAQALYIPPALLLPGGSMLVGGVCEIDELPFELRWPNHATDTCPFTPEYIREATGEMPPQFTTVDNDVPQEL